MRPPSKMAGQRTVVPRATYRLQFHEGFPLSRALALLPYLHELGISHIYASPLFKARPHSTHGYDTCDFNQLNPELGTEADLNELVEGLRARGMGLVLDIVPNHMGVGGPENRWWWDVLARGPESPFASYFDIDWNSSDPRLRGKVLAPVLGDRYQRVLARHELKVEASQGVCLLRYGENDFPISVSSLKTAPKSPEELNLNLDALDALIEQQFYRLAWFGRGDRDLNYRRFFNITSLPGLRVEDEKVFDQVFVLLQRWLERGWLDGLRVDHVDGLRDPEQFLQRLNKIAPHAWIVVEKILQPEEELPVAWPVAGTTGYDFLNYAGGLFVDPKGEEEFTRLYHQFGGHNRSYSALARDKKRLALRVLLAAEVERLTNLLLRITAGDWRHCDFTREELSDALIECSACFPVYRTYARPDRGPLKEKEAKPVLEAAREAQRARPDLPTDLFELLFDLLLQKQTGDLENEFVARFQQLSSATMAKGVEDTAFYCFNRFVALNEVGGYPGHFGVSVDQFNQFCRRRQSLWPSAMLASSTHDTKRSEDVRARLWLLSEISATWSERVGRWFAMNKRHRSHGWPDSNTEYFYYQMLVGAWPLSTERAAAYMEKAVHEAGEQTRWTNRNTEYDSAVRDFVVNTLADRSFTAEVEKFVTPLLKPGCINSLAQTLLKLAAPGVPDIYQGTELWDLSLVDPDNRRTVDFAFRQDLLSRTAKLSAEEAWGEWPLGVAKLWLIHRVLNFRARRPELFAASAKYEALMAQGEASAHVVAFKRGEGLIALLPRLAIGLHDDWRDTALGLPPGTWHNELTGESMPPGMVPVSVLLGKFPVALLVRDVP